MNNTSKASPLKKQLLSFEEHEVAQKNVADLGKPLIAQIKADRNIFSSSLTQLKPVNLLKSRKKYK